MTKSDELHKNDYSENAVEIHQLQARNRTSSKDDVTNIRHGLQNNCQDSRTYKTNFPLLEYDLGPNHVYYVTIEIHYSGH